MLLVLLTNHIKNLHAMDIDFRAAKHIYYLCNRFVRCGGHFGSLLCEVTKRFCFLEDHVMLQKEISSTGLVDPTSTASAADDGISPKTSICNETYTVKKESWVVQASAYLYPCHIP